MLKKHPPCVKCHVLVLAVFIFLVIPVFVSAQTIAPPSISSVSAIEITTSSAIITWATNNVPSDSQVEYGLTTTYGLQTAIITNFVLGHIVQLSNLSPSTVYHYRVKSKDTTGKIAVSQDYTFTTTSGTSLSKLIISNPQVINVARNSANIVWTTNNLSDSHIYYSYSSTSTISSWNHFIDSALVSYHNLILPGLKSGTTTYFFVESIDKNLNSAKSGVNSFVTTIDITSPQISNILAENITKNFATITWTTNEPMDSYVEYGTAAPYYLASAISTSSSIFVKDHSVNLHDLKDGYLYHYRIKSKGKDGTLAISDDQTFQTISSCTGLNFGLNKTTFLPSDYVVYTFSCLPFGSAPMINIQMLKPNGVITTLATVYNKSEGSINFLASTDLTINPLGTYKLFACFTSNCQIAPIATATFTIVSNENDNVLQTTSNIPSIVASTADLQATIKQLQDQIKTLQAQIEELKTQVAEVNLELNLTRTLRRGSNGDDVKQLQVFLKQQYPNFYFGPITGYFGSLTESAIKKLQAKEGIESIGVVGPKTLSKLNELITEGAGASGIIPPGLLTAPGIQKKIEISTTTTPIVIPTVPIGTTTVPIPAQPATAVPTGVCLIKDIYTDIPRFDIANFGNGFGKYAISGVNTVAGLQTACTQTIYNYLLQTYCKSNSNPVQRLIATYNYQGIGESQSLSCGSQGCDFVNCSTVASLAPISIPTTTPSGTTPAIPATPAQPISVTGISTVPAIPATPAVPATTTATTTPTTTSQTPVISSVSATFTPQSIEPSLAKITFTWNTNVQADSRVEYTKTVFPSGETSSNEIVYSHSIVLYLALSTTYKYKVKSMSNGVLATSAEFTITTPAAANTTTSVTDTTSPVISNVRAENITTSGAQIKWTTNEPTDGIVDWGISNSAFTGTSVSCSQDTSRYVTDHCIDLGVVNLSPGTTYYYKVRSDDQASNFSYSSVQQFTTAAAPASTLSVSPTDLAFAATVGTSPNQQTLTLTNSHSSIEPNNSPYTIYWVRSSSVTWLSTYGSAGVIPPGVGPGYLPVTIDVSGLTAGTYPGTLTFSQNSNYGSSFSPKVVNVTLTVTSTTNSTTTTSSLYNSRAKNLAAILQITGSLNEILEKLSQLLK